MSAKQGIHKWHQWESINMVTKNKEHMHSTAELNPFDFLLIDSLVGSSRYTVVCEILGLKCTVIYMLHFYSLPFHQLVRAFCIINCGYNAVLLFIFSSRGNDGCFPGSLAVWLLWVMSVHILDEFDLC